MVEVGETVSEARRMIEVAQRLAEQADALCFSAPVTCIYNPLRYAWAPHERYLTRYGSGRKRVVFLGMNPGPWGMAQTGVPFGEVSVVRDWMGIQERVGKPAREHPKRPVEGFDCPRSEVSGRRLWGLMGERFGGAQAFFADHFVANYCPLVFLEESGRNRTPDKLPLAQRRKLLEICDNHLRSVIDILKPVWVIGIGRFTEGRVRDLGGEFGAAGILHPSPASPQANRGWAERVSETLVRLGVWKD